MSKKLQHNRPAQSAGQWDANEMYANMYQSLTRIKTQLSLKAGKKKTGKFTK